MWQKQNVKDDWMTARSAEGSSAWGSLETLNSLCVALTGVRMRHVAARKWAVITAVHEGNMLSCRDDNARALARAHTHPCTCSKTDGPLMSGDVITTKTQLSAADSCFLLAVCPQAADTQCSALLKHTQYFREM